MYCGTYRGNSGNIGRGVVTEDDARVVTMYSVVVGVHTTCTFSLEFLSELTASPMVPKLTKIMIEATIAIVMARALIFCIL